MRAKPLQARQVNSDQVGIIVLVAQERGLGGIVLVAKEMDDAYFQSRPRHKSALRGM